ncbi:SEA (Seh1-associated) complex subunit, partial [Ascosphaera acerosa]
SLDYFTSLPISSLDKSPDQTRAVIAGREVFRILRVSPSACTEEFDIRAAITSRAASQYGLSGAIPVRYRDQLAINDVKWSHGDFEHVVATAAANGRVIVYDLNRNGVELARFHEHGRQVHKLAFSPFQPAWLLSGSQDESIRMWDLRMVSSERSAMGFGSKYRFLGHNDAVRDVRWSPVDGVEFAAATDSGVIQHWDVRKHNAPLLKLNAHDKACYCIDWHPDGKHVLSGGSDKYVKVWDCSTGSRNIKPRFQLRTPQSAVNVRWRPATAGGPGSTAWQTTQLAVGYDSEDSRIHVWDLRRPHRPHKEIFRPGREPTDLLWASSDLLWAVGSEGSFNQADVRFVAHIDEQRRPCAAAWSPSGEVLVFGQKRTARRAGDKTQGIGELSAAASPRLDASPSNTGFAASDDAGDLHALHRAPSGRGKRGSKPTNSRGSATRLAPSVAEDDSPSILPLTTALSQHLPTALNQCGLIGTIEDATADPHVFRYLGQNYHDLTASLQGWHSPGQDPITSLCHQLDTNAGHAEAVARYQLAQTWRVISYLMQHQVTVTPKPQTQLRDMTAESSIITTNARHMSEPTTHSTVPLSSASKSWRHSSGKVLQSTRRPRASSLATLPSNSWSEHYLPEPAATMVTAEQGRNQIPDGWTPADGSDVGELALDPQSTSHMLDDNRLSPRSQSPEAGQLLRQQMHSADTLTRFAASHATGSHLVGSYHPTDSELPNVSRTPLVEASLNAGEYSAENDGSGGHSQRLLQASVSVLSASIDRPQHSDQTRSAETGVVTPPIQPRSPATHGHEENAHLTRPLSPLPFVRESRPLASIAHANEIHKRQPHGVQFPPPSLDNQPVSLSIAADASGYPWTVDALLRQAALYYCSAACPDMQAAAHMLHILQKVDSTASSVSERQIPSYIAQAYNELLLRQRMFIVAAELRLACVPSLPEVYDYAQQETFINVYCFTCRKPFENPVRDNSRCHRCQTTQLPCPICESRVPPRDWLGDYAQRDAPTTKAGDRDSVQPRFFGGALWIWCQGCGHGAHAACMSAWLSAESLSEGGCPTPGCWCDCGPGERRDRARTPHKRLRSAGAETCPSDARDAGRKYADSMVGGQSKAVERVRRSLGVAPMSRPFQGPTQLRHEPAAAT